MSIYWAYAAGIMGSLCYGVATVLEQVGVRNSKKVKQINASIFIKFFKQIPYLQGFVLDLVGWVFILYAVRNLPLFLVQSFVASSLIVSALVDHYWLHTKVAKLEKLSIALVLCGITLLSLVAHPGPAESYNDLFVWIVVLAPMAILVLSSIMIKARPTKSTSTLIAITSGIAFGGTSVASRILSSEHIYLMSVASLLIASLIAYGILGILLLSVALQREKINLVNSALFSSEVAIPSILGLVFLGDKINSGRTWVIYVGLILVITGTISITLGGSRKKSTN